MQSQGDQIKPYAKCLIGGDGGAPNGSDCAGEVLIFAANMLVCRSEKLSRRTTLYSFLKISQHFQFICIS